MCAKLIQSANGSLIVDVMWRARYKVILSSPRRAVDKEDGRVCHHIYLFVSECCCLRYEHSSS